jgi:exodeoxyribonuclease V beta subunit
VKAREKFDIIRSALASEITLIEASAGTGKTYTISGLVLRMVLEKQLAIEEILVTTYTELATAELRDRIRNLLFQALTAFQIGESEDELIQPLVRRYKSDEQAQRRLSIALQSFDGASIYTIHGFAQRMLRDRAFESGALFDAELIADQSDILHEITDDFWRKHFYSGEPIVTTFAIKNGLTLEKFFRHITELTNNPTLVVIPPPLQDIETIKAECAAIWNKLRDCWNRCEGQIRTIFEQNAWAKYTHGNPAKMAILLAKLGKCLSNAAGAQDQLDCIEKFAFSTIEKSVRVRFNAPKHELFTLCDSLLNSERKLCVSLQAEFFAWARQEMKRRKVKRNVLSFDDMLTRFDEALSREGERCSRAQSASDSKPHWLTSSRTPIRSNTRFFKRSMAGERCRSFLSVIPNRQSTGFAAPTFLPTLRRRHQRQTNSHLAKTGAQQLSLFALLTRSSNSTSVRSFLTASHSNQSKPLENAITSR